MFYTSWGEDEIVKMKNLLVFVITIVVSSPSPSSASSSFLNDWFDTVLDINHDGVLSSDEIALFIWRSENENTNDIKPDLYVLNRIKRLIKPLMNDKNQFTRDEFGKLYGRDHNNNDSPQQIHLSLGATVETMTVMWLSSDNTSVPTVQYSQSSSIFPNPLVATGRSYTYTVSLYTSLSIHYVNMTVKPNTFYYYRVGSHNITWSSVYNFTSAPLITSSPTFETIMAVYGDMGTMIPFGYLVTKELILNQPYDLIFHVGDLAYAGVNKYGAYQPTWDVWMNQIEPLSRIIPYQVGVGNHENYNNYLAFNERFQMQSALNDGSNHNFWYSFDYGNIHVTSMSTEHDYSNTSDQYKWIEEDLRKARERNVTWLFVGGHRPYYCSDKSEYSSHKPGAPLLHWLEPLFVKYNVDLVLTGHMHMYERTYPVINGTRINDHYDDAKHFRKSTAPIYIVQGTAGALIDEEYINPQPVWSAKRLQAYGFGRLNVFQNMTTGESNIHYQFVSNEKVIDEFFITT